MKRKRKKSVDKVLKTKRNSHVIPVIIAVGTWLIPSPLSK